MDAHNESQNQPLSHMFSGMGHVDNEGSKESQFHFRSDLEVVNADFLYAGDTGGKNDIGKQDHSEPKALLWKVDHKNSMVCFNHDCNHTFSLLVFYANYVLTYFFIPLKIRWYLMMCLEYFSIRRRYQ
jgi:hypothetical protein